MTKGRRRIVQSIIAVAVLATVVGLARQFGSPRLIFRNRDVFWYVTEPYKTGRPGALEGDREVEGVFDYRGPRVGPPYLGPVRQRLLQWHLWPRWQPPPMKFGDVVLSDENDRELARMPGNGDDPHVHPALRTQANDSQLYVSWYFDLPPQVDRSKLVKFSTMFSINGLAPLPVRVTIPPIARPTKAPAR